MALNKVEICGVNTAKLPLLKEEEKHKLFERIADGDLSAREQYIEGNLRLVLSVIKRFAQSEENVEGIVVVAEGGENSVVVRNITDVVRALFDVDSHKIKVIDSK